MYTTTLLYSIVALATTALAAPAPAPSASSGAAASSTIGSATGTEGVATYTPAGGALSPTKTAAPLNVAAAGAPPKYMTISIVNKIGNGHAITTSHASNFGAPSAVSGNVAPGTIANGATAAFAVPTGWAGNVAINDASFQITGDDSLIEASFDTQGGSVGVPDIDVSFVNGFSLAITCACQATSKVITGCNKNLLAMSTCPNKDGQNACPNPLRTNDGFNLTPSAFFAPCKGAAYTYPHDDLANANGVCQSGVFMCCVGAACPANPNQPK